MSHILRSCGQVTLALLLILTAFILTGCRRRVISVEEVDKMIKEQVPVGSDKQQVKAFIDNLKVDSLKIDRGEFRPAIRKALVNTDPEKLAELGDRIAEYTSAVINHSQTDLLSSDDIVITFFVDKDGKMIGYSVKELGK